MNLKLIQLICFLVFDIDLILCKLNKELDCKCRLMTEKRIAGSKITHHLAYPFLAAIFYNRFRFANKNVKKLLPEDLKMSGLTCSATIINQNFLITSSSCILNMNYLTIGLTNKNDLVKMFDDDHIPIKRVIKHPKFDSLSDKKDFGYNLALIELEKPINFTTNSINPACLAVRQNASEITSEKSLNTELYKAAGWGSIINEIETNDKFKNRFLKEIYLIDKSNRTVECLNNSKLMCTRSLNPKYQIVFNDLGGSVIRTINGKSYVVSILSNLEIKIDEHTEKAYFTDLSFSSKLIESIDWIKQHVGDDYCSN